MYASTLCAYQPLRGPDMLAYMFLMASAQREFSFPACLAYDVAFRKKAGKFRPSTWGQLDPQLYAKAFIGSSKTRASSHCTLCLEATHPTADCPLHTKGTCPKAALYTSGPAKKPRTAPAGPKRSGPPKELCLNFNRGRCTAKDCPRAHVCSVAGCGGTHPAGRCALHGFFLRAT